MLGSAGRVVLVVEDSPADQEILRRAFLAVSNDCDIRVVADGETALSYLQQTEPFDLPSSAPQPGFAKCFITKPAAFQDFVNLIRHTCSHWFEFVKLPPQSSPGPSSAPGRPNP